MLKQIDADYYGYMDDDDGLLIPVEDKCEKEAIRKKIDEWKTTENAEGQIDETFEIPEMDVRFRFCFCFRFHFRLFFSRMTKIMLPVD